MSHFSRKHVATAAIALTALFVLPGVTSCSHKEPETVIVAVPPLEQNALLYIAEAKGFFEDNGLNVVIKDYDSGVTSMNAMLDGEADIAESAEFPFVRVAFEDQPARIIACNDRFENNYIIARKDRGIEKIADLKGKTIGVTQKTITEFYLGRLLDLNGISPGDLKLVNVNPDQFSSAFSSGAVDALIAWQPNASMIQQASADSVIFPAQSSQAVFGILSARTQWLETHAATVEIFLSALNKAEEFLIAHPADAKSIVQQRLGYSTDYVASIWPQHRFGLTLDLSLIAAMNDEARWVMDNGLTTGTTTPDFHSLISTAGLKKIKPGAVNISD